MTVELIRISNDAEAEISDISESTRVAVLVIEGKVTNFRLPKSFAKPLITVIKCDSSESIAHGSHLCFAIGGVRIGNYMAEEAVRLGIINRVFSEEEIETEVLKIAERIASLAPLAIRAFLRAVNEGSQMPLEEGLEFEAKLFAEIFTTEDAKEGINAFLQKRQPKFQGK